MAERKAPTAAPKATVKPRQITQEFEHVVDIALDRRDGKGKLINARIDFKRGTVVLTQLTSPISLKGKGLSAEVADFVQFFEAVKEAVDNAPAPALIYDEDAEDAEDAEETTPEA